MYAYTPYTHVSCFFFNNSPRIVYPNPNILSHTKNKHRQIRYRVLSRKQYCKFQLNFGFSGLNFSNPRAFEWRVRHNNIFR